MSRIGENLRVTGHSSQGERKYMEDAFAVAYQQTEDGKSLEFAFFGVYDGHGGKEAALFAKEHLMSNIVNLKYFWSDDDSLVLKAIRDGFLATHLAMWKEVENWPKTTTGLPSTAGTTASVAFVRNGKLYIGHVGDSKIVLGYSTEGCEVWQPECLTKDHKPDSPSEKKRIYNSGGLVMNKSGVERVVWNRPRPGHQGPVRRSTDFDKIPFLAVARSLGDLWSYDYFHEEFVVSPEPDVSVITLDPEKDHCIIFASDGVWNVLTPWDAVLLVQDAEQENEDLVLKYGISDRTGAILSNPSKVLVDCALERWSRLRMRADNTTVVSVMLDPPGPSKSKLRQEALLKMKHRYTHFEINEMWIRSKTADENIESNNKKMCSTLSERKSCGNCHYELRPDYIKAGSTEERCMCSGNNYATEKAGPSGLKDNSRTTSSPLQSCSNFLPKYTVVEAKSVSRKCEGDGNENSPCPFPRWSKSASGQTSLSKLASWSKMVNRRRMSDPFPCRTANACAIDSVDGGHMFGLPSVKLKQMSSKETNPAMKDDESDTCANTLMNNSSLSKYKFQTDDSDECNHIRDNIFFKEACNNFSIIKQAIKRKYSGAEVSQPYVNDCLDYCRHETTSPWKQKPVPNRLSITALKAINEFRQSRHHIQKL